MTNHRLKNRIHSLINDDKFILIILDACKYDYFKENNTEYIEGNLEKVWSEGSRTPRWIPRTWTDDYNHTYVSGAPYMSDLRKDDLPQLYTPSKHFEKIIPVWANNWDEKRYITQLSAITETALQHVADTESPRLVVHYLQPHQPYIGDNSGGFLEAPEIPIWNISESDYSMDEIHRHNHPQKTKRPNLPKYPVAQQLKDNKLDVEEWRGAYRSNLRSILGEVQKLLKHIDPDTNVVISSDHGEYLGEHSELLNRRLTMHPSRTSPTLREVPWFSVSDTMKGG